MRANGSVDPVVLVALGSGLLSDGDSGKRIIQRLADGFSEWGSRVEFAEAGGPMKYPGRKAVVFVDAIRMGHKPGSVHVLRGEEIARSAPEAASAIESLGAETSEVAWVGLEPDSAEAGVGMAASFARMTINGMLRDNAAQ